MTALRFSLTPYELNFEHGSEYPTSNSSELVQAQDRTAGGTLRVETLGVTIRRQTIVFTQMPLIDYEALVDWYLNICKGAEEVFDYTNEYGDTFPVRLVSGSIVFTEEYLDIYSGSIVLEFV